MHYWRRNNALHTLGVPWPAAAGHPRALAGIISSPIMHCGHSYFSNILHGKICVPPM